MSWTSELSNPTTARISVVVGILVDHQNRVLISQRPAGKHLAGLWEFPGGKLEPGESPREALARELDEELGVTVNAAEQMLNLDFSYPDRQVILDVWWVAAWAGEPQAREGQILRWVSSAELPAQQLLPADEPIVARVTERLAALSKVPGKN